MSSAGRCDDRVPDDNYPTDDWVVHRLIEAVDLPGGLWAEPCAGDGAIIRAVNSVRSDVEWIAGDIRPEVAPLLRKVPGKITPFAGYNLLSDEHYTPKLRRDFGFDRVRVVLTNPAYWIARALIERMLELFPKAIVVNLLRMNFYGSGERAEWMARHRPGVRVLPNRPSFRLGKKKPNGKRSSSDSCEYGWFTWRCPGIDGTIDVLATTPKDVRLAAVRARRLLG